MYCVSLGKVVFNSFSFLSIFVCCFSLPFKGCTASTSGNETDRLALLAFKSQIAPDSQNILSSWNSSQHFCEWEGVECSHRHQRVTILNLTSRGLTGSISAHVGNLSFLRTLVLDNNSFSGEIPDELSYLFRLVFLSLNYNLLVGNIPVNISKCSNLINLFANQNNLGGNIPIQIGSLRKLLGFGLAKNEFIGGIPPSLGNITYLEAINLSGNDLGGSIPTALGQLEHLRILFLASANLSGILPPRLSNISTLEGLAVQDNHLTGDLGTIYLPNVNIFEIAKNHFSGPIPSSLFNASSLHTLDMSNNFLTGNVPLSVGHLRDVRYFFLHVNNLGSGRSGDLDFFTPLTNCSNLLYLHLESNNFGGMLPSSVANLSNTLEIFSLYTNQVYGEVPSGVGRLTNLFHLNLYQNLFSGSIPKSIGDLQNLQRLDLSGNHFSGQIPSSIRNMSRLFSLVLSNNNLQGSIASILDNLILQTLDLSFNNFTGTIPKYKLGLSVLLRSLTLAHNSLNGTLPSEVGNLKSLWYLDISENSISGEMPATLGSCSSLEQLYVQSNSFSGSIPSSLGSLKGLQVLDLSRNNITGEIPKELERLSVLQYLNLSFNNLEGEVPVRGVFRNASAFSVVGNYKICGGVSRIGLPQCSMKDSKRHKNHIVLKVTFAVLIPSFMLVLVFVIYLWRKPKAKPELEQFMGDIMRVSYHDLYKATDGFSSENMIGTGSYGSVYKGILRQIEYTIAVKIFYLLQHGALKSFVVECEALREIRHRNLLKILTVCSSVDFNGNDFKALVFEFMPNGSLESWLHPNSNGQQQPGDLSFYQRLSIATDIALALDYLHNHCGRVIVHCDLKSSNVLLGADMTAHVADFGLAKFLSKSQDTLTCNQSHSSSAAIRGTIGYIPPEYGIGREVSPQGDMYSYGVLLLEMITGKRPTDQMFGDGLNLHDFAKMALARGTMDVIDKRMLSDEALGGVTMEEHFLSILKVGVACSVEAMAERMKIKEALKELSMIKEICFRARHHQ